MNWIDEIRDPEPRKRYIYNADDYDPQYGDPYYREHSTRADSLWRLYESSMDPSRRSPRTGTRWEATR